MIDVLLHNPSQFQTSSQILVQSVRQICADHGVERGEVSLAIVDDKTIHQLNRDHLQHDYPTDVLSFLLEHGPDGLEGEVIVSAETADRVAGEYGWTAAEELLLYCIHGTLHLVGYDDHTEEDRQRMREQERYYLQQADVTPVAARLFSNSPDGKKEASA